MRSALALAVVALVAVSCTDIRTGSATPTGPSGPSSPSHRAVIEFRVTGNALGAVIRYGTSDDGTAQVTSALPFLIEVSTAQPQVFLSLDVTPTMFSFVNVSPFLSAQIVVDGLLFRQAIATDASLSTLSISGTWRSN
jgi:hypothetical protein